MLYSTLVYEGEEAYQYSMAVKKFLDQEGTVIDKDNGLGFFMNYFHLDTGGVLLTHRSSEGGHLVLNLFSGNGKFLDGLENMLKENFPKLKTSN